ncbi:MAG: TA system VapC family ribonuclease toxin [Candidatus Korobacteraceae bacterium]
MRGFLIDVNVLIALLHEAHESHNKVQRWFRELDGKPWATCSLTQAGFVRIVSNPRFSEHPVDLGEALEMLSVVTHLPSHRFWPMDIDLAEAVAPFHDKLFGHRQVTDAYLLGLAIRNKGSLVTLDRAIEAMAGAEFAQNLTVLQSL